MKMNAFELLIKKENEALNNNNEYNFIFHDRKYLVNNK